MKKIILFLLSISLLIMSFAGCTPVGNEVNLDNDTEKTFKTTLYFSDSEAQKVVKEEREIDISHLEQVNITDKVRLIIEELIKGSEIEGHSTCIPANTKVNSVQIAASVLVVDFSKEFETEHNGGSTGIIMTFAPLVLSLTELEEVEEIWFLIDGEPIEEFKGHMMFNRLINRKDYEIYMDEEPVE